MVLKSDPSTVKRMPEMAAGRGSQGRSPRCPGPALALTGGGRRRVPERRTVGTNAVHGVVQLRRREYPGARRRMAEETAAGRGRRRLRYVEGLATDQLAEKGSRAVARGT